MATHYAALCPVAPTGVPARSIRSTRSPRARTCLVKSTVLRISQNPSALIAGNHSQAICSSHIEYPQETCSDAVHSRAYGSLQLKSSFSKDGERSTSHEQLSRSVKSLLRSLSALRPAFLHRLRQPLSALRGKTAAPLLRTRWVPSMYYFARWGIATVLAVSVPVGRAFVPFAIPLRTTGRNGGTAKGLQ